MMNQSAIYAGTFDPITLGHLDVIERAARVFPRLVLAVAATTGKQTLFSTGERQ
jgi:pantetheine-phosphate adenylyltransferase